MMDWTDRHCRYFMRLLSPSAELYTEMVTAAAIHHGDADRLLRFDKAEHRVVVQLGGSDPALMAAAARRAAEEGYDEININVGCPSDRVQSGQFGACLMADPDLVANCFRAMRAAVDIDVTVKSRIGIDDKDSYEFLDEFVTTLADAGCRKFIVHARIALLSGLSPKENRSIPPLRYPVVYRLKEEHPGLEIVINGGIRSLADVNVALEHVDGVMIGREAYHNPYFLARLEQHVGSGAAPPDRSEIVSAMLPYVERELAAGARTWRRYLSENTRGDDAPARILTDALEAMRRAAA